MALHQTKYNYDHGKALLIVITERMQIRDTYKDVIENIIYLLEYIQKLNKNICAFY